MYHRMRLSRFWRTKISTMIGLTRPHDELLNAATRAQLFQSIGNHFEQTDGPLLTNVFICSFEDKLDQDGKFPSCYQRYVDDTPSLSCLI